MRINNEKLIEMTIAAILNGEPLSWVFSCSKSQLKALTEALVATRQFEKKLFNENACLVEVSDALRVKHAYAKAFQRAFGQKWPL